MRIVNFLLGLFLAVDAFVKLGVFAVSTKVLGVLELVVGIAIIVIAVVLEYHHRHGTAAPAPIAPIE